MPLMELVAIICAVSRRAFERMGDLSGLPGSWVMLEVLMTSPDVRVGCVNGGSGAHANSEAVSTQRSVEAVRWSGLHQRMGSCSNGL